MSVRMWIYRQNEHPVEMSELLFFKCCVEHDVHIGGYLNGTHSSTLIHIHTHTHKFQMRRQAIHILHSFVRVFLDAVVYGSQVTFNHFRK